MPRGIQSLTSVCAVASMFSFSLTRSLLAQPAAPPAAPAPVTAPPQQPAPAVQPAPPGPAPTPATPPGATNEPAQAPLPPETAPVVTPPEPTTAEPARAPVTEVAPQPEVAAPPPAPQPIVLQPEAPAAPEQELPPAWYEKLQVSAFVDAYFGFNYFTPKPQAGRNRFRAYDTTNGFALSAAALDLSYDAADFGGTVALRFGPSAGVLAGADAGAGLQNVKQAYATWRPGGVDGGLSLDFGKFDTIFGAEVADSHLNYNYTRGLVHWLAQPAHHTGLRAAIEFSPQFWMTALLVNGWNNAVDNNLMKTIGVQFSTSMPNSSDPEGPALLDAHIGYLGGPEQVDYGSRPCPTGTFDPSLPGCNNEHPENSPLILRDAGESNGPKGFRHFVDLIVGLSPSRDLSFLLNADVGFEGVRDGDLSAETLPDFASQLWWGVALLSRYQLDTRWAGALRAEIYGDPDARATADGDPYLTGVQDLMLYSGTLTFEYLPTPNLIFRLDNRADLANETVFPEQLRSYGKVQLTSTFGVVVTTD